MRALHIIAGARTPFCRAGSALADLDAVELGRAAISSLITRTGLDPALVDETILGCVGQPPDAQNIARVVALRAGVLESRPAMTVHRNCASGLEAVTTAHQRLQADQGEVFIAGGAESMSNLSLYFARSAARKFAALSSARSLAGRMGAMAAFRPADFLPIIGLKLGLTDPVPQLSMGETAEVLARELGISREAQDAFALRSQLRAAGAAAAFAEEIAPVFVAGKAITADNGIRPDSTPEKLARLRPMFDAANGTVTAGNASQITDGAVALLVAGDEAVERHGWQPMGRLVDYVSIGCDPVRMGLGPVRAIHDLLQRTRTTLEDYDVIEINEAFAAQVLAVLKCLRDPASARRAGLDEPLGAIEDAQLNPCGGAIALGHPVGASGARLVLAALRRLRAIGGRRALVSLCVGGGQGVAAALEVSES